LSAQHAYGPREHYDRVGAAWSFLLGSELHYGVFDTPDEELPIASRRLTRMMAEAAQLEPGARVLDVGCGSGAPALYLVVEHGVHVTGITTSVGGVATARARARTAGLSDRAEFLERDGMANDFPSGSFDRVWVLESSHLMRRRDRLISECARTLKPGGRAVLCDIVLRRELPLEEVRERRAEFALLRDVFGAARMEPVAAYKKLLAEQGLEIDTEVDLTARVRPTFSRWRENAAQHRDEVVALLGGTEIDDFVASCDVLDGLWQDGTLGYALLAAWKPV